jgi:hypothetical protein
VTFKQEREMEEVWETRVERRPALRRLLGLPLLVLYGTGITVGAGIYVLIGVVARHADAYGPSLWRRRNDIDGRLLRRNGHPLSC